MNASLIVTAFLKPLAAAFSGAPKDLEKLGDLLAGYCPRMAAVESLERAARHLIETRRQKSFPPSADLIAIVRNLPEGASTATSTAESSPTLRKLAAEKLAATWPARERRAAEILRGTQMAEDALAEGWARALLDFVMKNDRAPDPREQQACIAQAKASDRAIANMPRGPFYDSMVLLRASMRGRADQALIEASGGTYEAPAVPVSTKRKRVWDGLQPLPADRITWRHGAPPKAVAMQPTAELAETPIDRLERLKATPIADASPELVRVLSKEPSL